MNNLIGEFGTTLAQSRIDEFVRESERVHLVSQALKERKTMPASRLWSRVRLYAEVGLSNGGIAPQVRRRAS